jgi:diguanylate cyclase (GGDEF)-like protein
LLPNYSLSETAAVAERIRAAIADLKFANYPRKATVSVGVASYPASFSSKEQFFKAADDALLTAKQAGRDRVVIAEGAGAAEVGAAS